MSNTHFEISKKMVYSIVSFLLICVIGLCIYIYEGDRAAIKTNQEAIQISTKERQKNYTDIKVGEERMNGHVVNKSAHN